MESDIENALVQHRNGIVKYCYSLLLDYHEAQDAAQDVALVAVKKAKSLRDVSAVNAWLYRIAYNLCMNKIRRKKLFNLFLQKETVVLNPPIHEDCYNFGVSPALVAALETLSHKDRALVYHRAVDGLEYIQLEAIYNIKAATLRKRYERARKKLENTLTPTMKG